MATAAIFVGYGPPISGREDKALRVFNEALEYYGGLQRNGDIESFEPVFLEPHGGDLSGFILLRGDRAKLEHVRYSPEFLRLSNRASLVVTNFGIVGGFLGEELQTLFQNFHQQVGELG
ncbi:MAG TPA: hypothetical protein VIC85_06775 [Ktedonobacterales bacterium]|jgi:hypothetical protein